MKRKLTLLTLVLVLVIPSLAATCPTTAECPEDGMNGNPTGQYKWQGATEYAQFTHPLSNGGKHTWWERCSAVAAIKVRVTTWRDTTDLNANCAGQSLL
jgi:hypothetical protein